MSGVVHYNIAVIQTRYHIPLILIVARTEA